VRLRRLVALLCVLAGAAGQSGCAITYLRNRGQDALDMFDIGVTFTAKPQFGLYANCPFTVPIGGAKVDGYYAGIGGGRVGIVEHHQDAVGLIVTGHEKVTWGSPDSEGGESGGDYKVGLLGFNTDAEGKPVYRPQCTHYLHLGFIGLTANINYKDIPDFFLGWFGLDIVGDDNRAAKAEAVKKRLETRAARLPHRYNGLGIIARTSKASYTPDEPIELRVELVNCSGATGRRGDRPRDVAVYFEPVAETPDGELAEWLFKFYVFDVYTGRQCYVSPEFKAPPANRDDLYHHATLAPGAFIGRRFVFAPARQWLKPGDYFILATYEVSNDYGAVILHPALTQSQAKVLGDQAAYTRVWTGRIYSNVAMFHVQRPRFLGLF